MDLMYHGDYGEICVTSAADGLIDLFLTSIPELCTQRVFYIMETL